MFCLCTQIGAENVEFRNLCLETNVVLQSVCDK